MAALIQHHVVFIQEQPHILLCEYVACIETVCWVLTGTSMALLLPRHSMAESHNANRTYMPFCQPLVTYTVMRIEAE